ncbi:hypothetical protein [Falsiroseomonas tokyonensis]|uniref:DUF1127 domain-containing protein n=1 Tax=Falsiroseomonas tokyonensis TaxID=430521 RepID=A0ABV7BNN0_9PROT|nr:hypothetical protein [Falsiroseomonas tokyonensis]MBU8536271.1 hypothetical protein [Falsiroseomonas tokyonensis]
MSASLAAPETAPEAAPEAGLRPRLAPMLSWLLAPLRALHQPWRVDLLAYDPHLLRDIGLTQEEALRIAGGRR